MKANILDILYQCFKEIPEKDSRAKIGPKEFVVTLVCSFFRDAKERTLSSLRREMMDATGKQISRGTFWERLATRKLTELLTNCVVFLISSLKAKQIGVNKLAEGLGVASIFLIDSTSVTLPKKAEADFPGTFVRAAIKWHLCLDLLSGVMQWFKLTVGTSHDHESFPSMNMLKGSLVIFDLGYWDYSIFKGFIQKKIFPFKGKIKCELADCSSDIRFFQRV